MRGRGIFAIAMISLVFSQAKVIVDREFDVKQVAEGIPLNVKYTVYNSYAKYFDLS